MAYATVTLTGQLATLSGGTIANARAWLEASVAAIAATDDDLVLHSPIDLDLDASDAFSVVVPATDDASLNPTGFQYRVVADIRTQGTGRPRRFSSGWFSLPAATATVDLADVVAEALVPPTFESELMTRITAEAEVFVDDAEDAAVLAGEYRDQAATAAATATAPTAEVVDAVLSDPTSDASATLAATFARTFDVQNYGAVAGETDATAAANTVAVEAAIADAVAAGGGIVYFPAGVWRLAPVSLGVNVALRGAGRASTTLRRTFSNTASGAFITIPTGATGCAVQDLTIWGVGSGLAQDCLYVNELTAVLTDVECRNASRYGVHVGSGGDSLRATRVRVHTVNGTPGYGFNVEGTDCFFTECVAFSTSGHGFHNAGENNHYTACYAYFCGAEGENVDGFYSKAPNGQFIGCFGQDNGRAGLYLPGNADFTTVTGFRGDSNGYAGLVADATLENGTAENLLSVDITGFFCLTRTAAPRYTQDYGIIGVGNILRSTFMGTATGNTTDMAGTVNGSSNNVSVRTLDNTGFTRLGSLPNNTYLAVRRSDGSETNVVGVSAGDILYMGGVTAAQTDVRLRAAGADKVRMNSTGVGFNGSAPTAKAANPGTATGTDAAVINALVTALRNLGLVT